MAGGFSAGLDIALALITMAYILKLLLPDRNRGPLSSSFCRRLEKRSLLNQHVVRRQLAA